MARPSKYNWEAIKEAYEGGIDKQDIVKKYKIDNKQLLNKIYNENWNIEKAKKDTDEIISIVNEIIQEVGIEQFQLFVDSFEKSLKYLYIIKMDRHRYYKIGIADNVKKRLATLQTGNPEKLTVLYKKEFAYCTKLEKHIHNKYKNNRKTGEWFTLKEKDLEELINYLSDIRIFNG